MKKILLSFFIGVMLIACNQKTVFVREVWTKEQANEWYKQWGWLRGCDFIPSTAINQMEMWQADTFDPVTIEQENNRNHNREYIIRDGRVIREICIIKVIRQ